MGSTESAAGRRAWGWAMPSLADLLVAALAVRPYFLGPGWETLLSDANAGLHILTGDMIRVAGRAPASEPFSFTLPAKAWFAWEWLTAVSASALHSWAGLGGVAVAAAALLAAWTALVYRNCVESGRQWILSAVLTMAACQAAANHMLARPHLITWVLLALAVGLCLKDRRAEGRLIWMLVPLSLVWANLHGGFLTLPVYLGLTAAGLAAEWLITGREAEKRRAAAKYAGLAGACLAVTVANPYGVQLHVHIFEYLRAGWLKELVQEYHAPSAKLGEPYYWFCGLALAAGLACVSQLRRREVAGPAAALFFGWAAFQSARHIPVFLTVALPVVAGEGARALEWLARRDPRRSLAATWLQMDAQMLGQASRFSLLLPAFFALALAMPARLGAPADFPARDFPAPMVRAQAAALEQRRLFTTDAWADYVLYHLYPRTRVFVDGMNDFFGPEIGLEYLEMLEAGPRTGELFERWGFEAALVPARGPLARWLKAQDGWEAVAEDRQSALFRRVKR